MYDSISLQMQLPLYNGPTDKNLLYETRTSPILSKVVTWWNGFSNDEWNGPILLYSYNFLNYCLYFVFFFTLIFLRKKIKNLSQY